MYKIAVLDTDLARQIELLKLFPEVVKKFFVPVFKRDVKALEGRIRPTIPVLSGRAQQAFGSKVTGSGVNLTGRVGWYDKGDPWYINVVEYGAKAHAMNKRSDKGVPVLVGGAGWRTIKNHPGFSERGFMAAGQSAMQPLIDADMAQANEAVAKELTVR